MVFTIILLPFSVKTLEINGFELNYALSFSIFYFDVPFSIAHYDSLSKRHFSFLPLNCGCFSRFFFCSFTFNYGRYALQQHK